MFVTEIIIYAIVTISWLIDFNSKNIIHIYLYYGVMTYLNYFVMLFVNWVNQPVEKCVYLKFKRQAQNKLKSMKLPVVGITGSYGKTSSKNILNDVLNIKFNSFATCRKRICSHNIIHNKITND